MTTTQQHERELLEAQVREHLRGLSDAEFKLIVAETRPPAEHTEPQTSSNHSPKQGDQSGTL